MAGFVIHLAIAQKHIENSNIKDKDEFIRGTIAPDILNKKGIGSHYAKTSGASDVKKFVETNNMETDYNKGYFLHLVTDVMFYKHIATNWSQAIYNDYDILNKRIIEKYGLKNIPEEAKQYAKFKDGELSILDYNTVIEFIEDMGNTSLEDLYKRYLDELEKND